MRNLQLPEGYEATISPDGRWYAYIVGDEGNSHVLPPGGVVLHIQNLWSDENREILSLLPADFYPRQVSMLEEFRAEYINYKGRDDPDFIWKEPYIRGFFPTWSPDGRYLAFAAMVNGNSTDLFVYDVDTKKVQQVDDDYLNLGGVLWSPDGKWIEFKSETPTNLPMFPYPTNAWYPAPIQFMENTSDKLKRSTRLCPIEWISSDEVIMIHCQYHDGGNGEETDLIMVNVATGAWRTIWSGDWLQYHIDWSNGTIDIINIESSCTGDPCNDYFFGEYVGPIYGIKVRKGNVDWFATSKLPLTDRSKEKISPDGYWHAYYGDSGLLLTTADDQIVLDDKNLRVYDVIWKTDSQGFYFMTNDYVDYVPVEKPSIQSVMECYPGICGPFTDFTLVPLIRISSLPNLRAFPPPPLFEKTGVSFWTKATFQDLLGPCENTYNATIPAYSTWRWDFSWCAKDADTLADILKPFHVQFFIGGQEIGEDIFRIYDQADSGGYCRNWATLLSGWQPGDGTDLEIRYTLDSPVNDGTRDYPAGEYRQIIHVTVQ